jgi:hypothetical protein
MKREGDNVDVIYWCIVVLTRISTYSFVEVAIIARMGMFLRMMTLPSAMMLNLRPEKR